MQLKRICLENFMIHRLTDIDCTKFNSVLIVGNSANNDRIANGVGKSTIFKAIDYALFGEHATKTLDKIIRDGCQKAKVVLDFFDDTGTFRVTRTRTRKGKSELSLEQELSDGSWKSLNQKTPSETEQELNKIVKISYSAFKNSVLFSQFDFFNGLTAAISSEARKSLLKEILNLVIYTKLEEISKQHVSILNKDINAEKAVLKSLGQPKNEIEACKILHKEKSDSLKSEILEKEKTSNTLETKRKELTILESNLNSNLDSFKKDLLKLKTSETECSSQIEKLRISLLQKNKIFTSSTNDQNKLLETNLSLEKELKGINDYLINNNLESLQEQLEEINTNEQSGQKLLQKQELLISQLSIPLPKSTVCESCRQNVSEDHLKDCQLKINEKLENAKSNKEDINSKLQIIKSRKTKKQEHIKQTTLKTNRKILIQDQIQNNLNSLKNINMSISSLKEEISNIQTEFGLKKDELIVIENNIQDLSNKIIELERKSHKEHIIILAEEISLLEREYKSIEASIQNLNLELGILSEKIKSKQLDADKIVVIENRVKELEKELKIRQVVTRGFSTSGIPSLVIMNTILEDLQTETNQLLAQIRPGVEIKFDNSQEDKLEIIYYVNGLEKDLEQLSGGQRVTIIFALKIGLLFALQNRLSIDIQFLELDEIDQSLDKATIDAFVDLVKKLQNNFKIFVITHNDDLKSKFSNIISVEYNETDGAAGRLVDN